MEPLRTERLLLRPARRADAPALAARRSDPQVAEYQNWITPFTLDDATALLTAAATTPGPIPDDWFMLTVTDPTDTTVYGDLALHLTFDGRCAEIGYTFAREHWGRGYAVEAVEALVSFLFTDLHVTRVHAQLHPDNHASAQVLERTGFLWEGHTRSSYWVGDECSDDWLYGMTRDDHVAWLARPRHHPDRVALVEITPANQRRVRALETHRSQRRFASPVLHSFADALVPEIVDGAPVVPWYRAVEADGELVGFTMLAGITDTHPEPYLWRLMVDRMHQRRGIGRRVLDLVADVARSWGATSILTSYVEGRGSPRPLYDRYGFVPTGEIDEGETVARLMLR